MGSFFIVRVDLFHGPNENSRPLKAKLVSIVNPSNVRIGRLRVVVCRGMNERQVSDRLSDGKERDVCFA